MSDLENSSDENLNDLLNEVLNNFSSNLPNIIQMIPSFISSVSSAVKDTSSKNLISIVKKLLVENNIKITNFFPNSLKNKSMIEIFNKSLMGTINYLYNIKDCVEFVNNNKQRDDLFRELFFEIIFYLNSLSTNQDKKEEKEEFIDLFLRDIDYIILKEINICNLNLSKTLKNCRDKNISDEKIKLYLESTYIILLDLILPKINDINFEDILTYYEI